MRQAATAAALSIIPVFVVGVWLALAPFGDWKDGQETAVAELHTRVDEFERELERHLNAYSTLMVEHSHDGSDSALAILEMRMEVYEIPNALLRYTGGT